MASAADVIARDYVMAYALTTIPQEPAMLEMTRCVHPRRIATEGFHSLAVPVHRGSTVVFDDALAYAQRAARGTYRLHVWLAGNSDLAHAGSAARRPRQRAPWPCAGSISESIQQGRIRSVIWFAECRDLRRRAASLRSCNGHCPIEPRERGPR
jgi:hypothetical protein